MFLMGEVPLYIRPSLARNESLDRTLFSHTQDTALVLVSNASFQTRDHTRPSIAASLSRWVPCS